MTHPGSIEPALGLRRGHPSMPVQAHPEAVEATPGFPVGTGTGCCCHTPLGSMPHPDRLDLTVAVS